jgi:hypothetical protein
LGFLNSVDLVFLVSKYSSGMVQKAYLGGLVVVVSSTLSKCMY